MKKYDVQILSHHKFRSKYRNCYHNWQYHTGCDRRHGLTKIEEKYNPSARKKGFLSYEMYDAKCMTKREIAVTIVRFFAT